MLQSSSLFLVQNCCVSLWPFPSIFHCPFPAWFLWQSFVFFYSLSYILHFAHDSSPYLCCSHSGAQIFRLLSSAIPKSSFYRRRLIVTVSSSSFCHQFFVVIASLVILCCQFFFPISQSPLLHHGFLSPILCHWFLSSHLRHYYSTAVRLTILLSPPPRHHFRHQSLIIASSSPYFRQSPTVINFCVISPSISPHSWLSIFLIFCHLSFEVSQSPFFVSVFFYLHLPRFLGRHFVINKFSMQTPPGHFFVTVSWPHCLLGLPCHFLFIVF